MTNLAWILFLIPLFPLLGFLANTFFVRAGRIAGWIASAMVVLSFITTLVAISLLAGQPEEARRLSSVAWEWISIGSFRVPFGLLFDPLTAVMALLVTGVGALIHIYSVGYMDHDERPARFFAAMNLFVMAMLFLIMGDNMLLMFLGWEGVGLCSFLLISHYFDRTSVEPGINPTGAAIKAFVTNRVGDIGIILAMVLLFTQVGTLNFFPTSSNGSVIPGFLELASDLALNTVSNSLFGTVTVATALGMLLLLGVAGKSAQFPLYTWLPDAMAGPTPVSALIHAATMVTSGVYLMARTHVVFEASPAAGGWAVGIGVLTALLAATAAIAQFDIKRVLAYSTVSQLGYMVAAVGMGAVNAGMFHLLTHGIFKALLFLAAGAVIHNIHDHQDMRRMGGLRHAMPTTFRTYLIGAFALAGIFPLAGFWSKDEIIGYAWGHGQQFTAILLIIVSMITAFYMGRQVALIFYGRQRDTSYHAHESPSIMTVPLLILAALTVLGGLINLPSLTADISFPGAHLLTDYLLPVTEEAAEPINWGIAIITTLLALGAGYLGWWLYAVVLADRIRPGEEDPAWYYTGDIWKGSELAWGIDWLYHEALVKPYRRAAGFIGRVFDHEAIDGLLVGGVSRGSLWLADIFRGAQTGYVRTYTLVFLAGVLVLVGFFAFR